ncbi:AIPR family protein [Ornithobacterium rhinotracheale]|uniref:AIPR family protein n=1 Tax=Ornithobacterium rhinotracheale TaxID=28251 RepID=UPI0040358A70
MANINDFKILNSKCENYYDILEKQIDIKENFQNSDKQRFGFYLFILEYFCGLKDVGDALEHITDKEFNDKILNVKDDDYGVDAIYIDEETKVVNLFNFKFRQRFNPDKTQGVNDSFSSAKFINAIAANSIEDLKGKIHDKAKEIIEKLESKDIWKIKLFIVSNDTYELDEKKSVFKSLKKIYDVEVVAVGLDTISKIMSLRPQPINAVIHLEKDSILPFAETSFSSSKSYIVKMSANELIRITCEDEELRNKYNIEDYDVLFDKEMDANLLFDNVRGFVEKSKFNANIYTSLKEDTSKFFMFNNGLTIIAQDIISEETNANKKIKLTIKDFQVVNGGQTLRTIHKFNKSDKDNISNYLPYAEILVRIFKTNDTSEPGEVSVKNKIAEYTNSQNSISNVDLKSLANEQIQIEQFLEEENIIYVRKSGDLGKDKEKKYTHRISMEKFGQILFSYQGSPEKASNQKKQIFDKYYKQIFHDNFEIGSSAELIKLYFELKKEYENSEYDSTDQKIFYIIYLKKKLKLENKKLIKFFETIVSNYRKDDDISAARKLINIRFKEVLDEEITKKSKKI